MYLALNDNNEIKGVGITTNPQLKNVYVDEAYYDYPFREMSEALICCYKIDVNENGIITMFKPYIDSRMLDHIDQLGKQTESITPYSATKKAYIDDTEVIFESDRKGVITCSAISDSGISIPTTFYVEGNKVIVAFMPLEEVATVSINIQ